MVPEAPLEKLEGMRVDPVISQVLEFVHTGWPSETNDVNLKPYLKWKTELSSCDGCLMWGNQVVIPEVGRAEVLQEFHDSHPGETRMKRLARMECGEEYKTSGMYWRVLDDEEATAY